MKDPRAGLLRKRNQQEEAIRTLQEEAETLRSGADLLLSHFPEVEERRLTLAGSAPGTLEFEIVLEGRPFRLKAGTPTREAAQALYEEAKHAQQRLEGAQGALRSTEAQLRSGTPVVASPRPTQDPGRPPARRRHFWFEKAPRFFVSSEGFVVIAGRDARTNDALVKRYLGEHDVYIHADLHGAPSVVIKIQDPKVSPGEGTLLEAGQWGLCHSRAWRAGLASADAYWVKGDQVSKAGASGEYVARGSWVIHGTRNPLRDLPLELTLGRVPYEGEMLLQAAPLSTFGRPGSQLLFGLRPGEDRDREAEERTLAQALGITREALQAVLVSPPVESNDPQRFSPERELLSDRDRAAGERFPGEDPGLPALWDRDRDANPFPRDGPHRAQAVGRSPGEAPSLPVLDPQDLHPAAPEAETGSHHDLASRVPGDAPRL